ncbi:DMT family transporter [Metallumcola ferriviriculae]|uniref:DMT family transporter n=1 Tax=Metallumcola ferriviriculae TaxID=3039180 RepID=A0AAU0UPW1_9FIRM|nr:DMT family transporter [Desulfitibacteraceae bacterium MK1]
MDNNRQLQADLLLLIVALIWGLTFVSVKNALVDIGPYTFNAIRFGIAFIFMGLFSGRKLRQINKKSLSAGMTVGMVLFAGYSFQTIGLQYTTASNAGFITGLSVVMVPLFARLLFKRTANRYAILGAITAAAGLGLLSLSLPLAVNLGDLLVLFCAASFALHIVFVGRYSPNHDTMVLVVIQIGTVAILSGLSALVWEGQAVHFTANVIWGLIITAIPATALAYLIQNWAQKFTTETRTAIILSMEPVFAALFALILLHEALGVKDISGGLLVLAGMLLAELKT